MRGVGETRHAGIESVGEIPADQWRADAADLRDRAARRLQTAAGAWRHDIVGRSCQRAEREAIGDAEKGNQHGELEKIWRKWNQQERHRGNSRAWHRRPFSTDLVDHETRGEN